MVTRLLFILLLIPFLCFAAPIQMMMGAVLARKNTDTGGIVDNCVDDTYELAWTGDNTAGVNYFCWDSGGSSGTGVVQDATVSSDYVEYSAPNDYLQRDVSGGEIAANIDEQGSLFFSFFCTDDGAWGEDAVVELTYSATQQINCFADGGNTRVRCNHLGGSESPNVLSTGLSVGTNYRCGYTWDATANTHAIDCVTSGAVSWTSNGGSPDDEDSEALDPFDDSGPVDATLFSIGENLAARAVSETTRAYDLYLITGYKATDPGSL